LSPNRQTWCCSIDWKRRRLIAGAACACIFLFCSVGLSDEPAERQFAVRLLGGDDKEPLVDVDIEITSGYGESQTKYGPFRTNADGIAAAQLPPGFYELHLKSEKEWPYLPIEELWKEKHRGPSPHLDLRVTDSSVEKWLDGKQLDAGEQPSDVRDDMPCITYTLLIGCELVLRAVDADTGAALSGAEFYEENAVGEEWAHAIDGDNLGWKSTGDDDQAAAEANVTNAEGIFRRRVSANDGFLYGVEKPPAGYESVEPRREVAIEIVYGQPQAEYTFKFRRKDTQLKK